MDGDAPPPYTTQRHLHISIHAAHMDGDHFKEPCLKLVYLISIHAAHMDGDLIPFYLMNYNQNFNPRRPYGRRHMQSAVCFGSLHISIHAAHMDGD